MRYLAIVAALGLCACGSPDGSASADATGAVDARTSSNVTSSVNSSNSSSVTSSTNTQSSTSTITSANNSTTSCSTELNGQRCQITCTAPQTAQCLQRPGATAPTCACK